VYELRGRHVFLRFPKGLAQANLTGPRLERALGVPATVRNWNTVTKLAELSRRSS
jgi:uncharacterized protein (DUF1697 family)